MSATCPRCGKSWSGARAEHCPSCHETFTGTPSGDRHRVGDHVLPRGAPGARRCLSPDEMRASGLDVDDRGLWFVVELRERNLARAAQLREMQGNGLEVPGT